MSDTYEVLGVIGQGQYGTAYKARHKQDNKLYCLKKIAMTAKDDMQGALNEAKLLSSLEHPNIIGYKESFLDKEGALSIVTTYCEDGDLFKRIRRHQTKNEYLNEKEVMDVFIQIASALAYIHSRKILHRDLKTQNIFIARGGIIQLGDFGISKVLEKTDSFATTVTGTPYYMAPEICTNQPYTFKSDIWSLGCVLYEVCTLKHAFAADSLLSLVYQIVRGNYPPIPADLFSPELEKLVETLLDRDPNTRPTLQQIFQLPYVMNHVKRYQSEQRSRVLQQRSSLNKSHKERLFSMSPAMRAQREEEMENLTPREKMQRRKEDEARRRELELQLASIGAVKNRVVAQNLAQKNLHGSGMAVVGESREQDRSPSRPDMGSTKPAARPGMPYEGAGGTMRSPGFGQHDMTFGDSMVNMGTMPTQGPGSTIRSAQTRVAPRGRGSIMDRDDTPAATGIWNGTRADRDNMPVGRAGMQGGRERSPRGRGHQQHPDEYDDDEVLMASVVHHTSNMSIRGSSPEPSSRAGNGHGHGGGIAGFKFGLDTKERASVNQFGFGAPAPEQHLANHKHHVDQSADFPGVSQVRFGIASDSRPRGSFVHQVIHSQDVLHNDDLDDGSESRMQDSIYEEEWDTYVEDLDEYDSEDEEVNEVKQRIKMLNNVNELSKSGSLESPSLDAAPHPEVADRLATLTKNGKLAGLQERCRGTLGAQFMEVYNYLKRVRSKGSPHVDEKEVQRKLLEIVGGDRQKLQGCFICDQLVFQEMMYE